VHFLRSEALDVPRLAREESATRKRRGAADAGLERCARNAWSALSSGNKSRKQISRLTYARMRRPPKIRPRRQAAICRSHECVRPRCPSNSAEPPYVTAEAQPAAQPYVANTCRSVEEPPLRGWSSLPVAQRASACVAAPRSRVGSCLAFSRELGAVVIGMARLSILLSSMCRSFCSLASLSSGVTESLRLMWCGHHPIGRIIIARERWKLCVTRAQLHSGRPSAHFQRQSARLLNVGACL
jgi:hypothetical protein